MFGPLYFGRATAKFDIFYRVKHRIIALNLEIAQQRLDMDDIAF
jgi:hypothetical protein